MCTFYKDKVIFSWIRWHKHTAATTYTHSMFYEEGELYFQIWNPNGVQVWCDFDDVLKIWSKQRIHFKLNMISSRMSRTKYKTELKIHKKWCIFWIFNSVMLDMSFLCTFTHNIWSIVCKRSIDSLIHDSRLK